MAQGPFDTHHSHVDPDKLDSWLAVASDGTVTAYTGKCDFGQGMYTVQTQLVAEELCVSHQQGEVDSVRYVRDPGSGNDLRKPIHADQFQYSESGAGRGDGARGSSRDGGAAD